MKRTQLKKGKTLTDTAIASLKAEIQEYSVKDSKGLYLFVKPTGAKSWKMRYKDGNGKWRWHGLGSYPAVTGAMARLMVQEKYKELALGAGELVAPTTAKKDSLADIWRIWLNEPQNKKLSNSTKVRHLSTMKHILPTLGKEPLKDIDRQKWLTTFRKIAEHTHHQTKKPTAKEAYRAWQLINRLYIFAINENLAMIESNPLPYVRLLLGRYYPHWGRIVLAFTLWERLAWENHWHCSWGRVCGETVILCGHGKPQETAWRA